MSTLMEQLADRCEAASGPDRALDRDIELAFPMEDAKHLAFGIPQYTGSIDAAMSLVPEGYDLSGASSGPIDGWRLSEWHVRFAPRCVKPRDGGYSFEELRALSGEGDGVTFPLAAAAAALRARARASSGEGA